MTMKKLTVLAMAVILSGCAGGNKNEITPMPIDSNPSIALQYARAMNLRLITDYEKGQYVIFNENTGKSIRPLKEPVVVGQKGEMKQSGNASADVLAGLITHTAFIPALSVLTQRAPIPYSDGTARVATWGGGNTEDNANKFRLVINQKLPLFNGFSENYFCKSGISYTVPIVGNVNANGTLSPIDLATLPKPPYNAPAIIQPFVVSECFNTLSQRKDNEQNVVAFSEALGEQWAIFVPGSPQRQPAVYRNGESFYFEKK
ncbi:Uncharacterised protein [Providencia rustigianii]|uniref:Lipoprotein n=9 Tax=Gammaproteobacteria TaxID=1236 RepID=A0A7L8KA49_ECOLX|nr:MULTISPECIES: hypothetical protein [Enterobacterales]SPY66635.1 Uncharacterised protein [Providencia stuartii]SUC33760.1 Uncharacterised protein [Providencia rustigianii]QOE89743.1 hypothetical protein [Escherichia coli]UCK65645.1 hypothetical protein [Providencia rettgeri]WAT94265.1 hypothetical protein OS905_00705 [Escherichia sp. J-18004577]